MLSQIYSGREGDVEILQDYYRRFQKLKDEELIQKCIEAKRQGIFGVHRQALHLIALFHVAKDRSISTELHVEGNGLLSFSN